VGPPRSAPALAIFLALVAVAVLGCAAFAAARNLSDLLLARFLIGVGVSACLMAPLTCFRHHFSASAQLQASSWMLMTGSLGMLASTLPVQWLLPLLGWRGLFMAVAVCPALAMLGVALLVPRDAPAGQPGAAARPQSPAVGGYRLNFAHPAFVRTAPLAFLCWGLLMPRLTRTGWAGERLIARAWPPGVAALAWIVGLGAQASAWMRAPWCVCTSVVSLAQPALAQQFPAALAGRALSALNLVIFSGVFTLQWGIGLGIDALRAAGLGLVPACQLVFGALGLACALSFPWLHAWRWRQAAVAAGWRPARG
jgi:MFS family permease